MITPRLQRVYEWSAEELGEPRLLELVRDGNPIYVWPFEQRHVWRAAHMPFSWTSPTLLAIVTGFGSATVRRLAKMGAKVVIADVSDERGEALAREAAAGPPGCWVPTGFDTPWRSSHAR